MNLKITHTIQRKKTGIRDFNLCVIWRMINTFYLKEGKQPIKSLFNVLKDRYTF